MAEFSDEFESSPPVLGDIVEISDTTWSAAFLAALAAPLDAAEVALLPGGELDLLADAADRSEYEADFPSPDLAEWQLTETDEAVESEITLHSHLPNEGDFSSPFGHEQAGDLETGGQLETGYEDHSNW